MKSGQAQFFQNLFWLVTGTCSTSSADQVDNHGLALKVKVLRKSNHDHVGAHIIIVITNIVMSFAVATQVKEECGYEVSADKLQWVTQYVGSVGTSGSRHDMFYAEVDESVRVNEGGGLE